MQFKIGDRVVHLAHGTGQMVNVLAPYAYKPSAAPLELVSRLKQGSFREGECAVVQHLTAWGRRKPHKPDRYNHLPENTGEPLSRMGDDG
jgi:hypothetical protein